MRRKIYRMDIYIERYANGRSVLGAHAVTLWHHARHLVDRMACRLRGHDLTEELVSAEDGQSELTCRRCGWSHDIQW
jgi:hypothetical protein